MSSARLVLSLFFILISVHILGIYRNWYWDVSWLDVPMHLLGGFFAAVLVLWLRKKNPALFSGDNLIADFIVILGLVSLISVFWEFFEFFLDYYSGATALKNQLSVSDTMFDLFFDLSGGVVAYVLEILWPRRYFK